MMEMLTGIRRAGADMILTYFAKEAAKASTASSERTMNSANSDRLFQLARNFIPGGSTRLCGPSDRWGARRCSSHEPPVPVSGTRMGMSSSTMSVVGPMILGHAHPVSSGPCSARPRLERASARRQSWKP